MYVHASRGLGHTLAQPVSSSPSSTLQTFLRRVSDRPADYLDLLTDVTLHPNPLASRTFTDQRVIGGTAPKVLGDVILFAGVEPIVVLDKLKQISAAFQKRNERFRQQIEAGVRVRGELMNTLAILGRDRERLKPYLLEEATLLLPAEPVDQVFIRLGSRFATKMLPRRLLARMEEYPAVYAHASTVGRWLRRYGEVLQTKDSAFKRLVDEKLRMMGK